MPVGAAPAGPDVGEEPSSVSVPPLTAKPLIAFEAVSTTQSVEPSGESRASSGPCAAASIVVLPSSVSEPFAAIE